MNNKAFTLVELLAVIIILVIIISIAVPSVTNVISTSTEDAFRVDAKMLIMAIRHQKSMDKDFVETNIVADNVDDLLGVSNDNYQEITVTKNAGVVFVYILGKNKWENLAAWGSYNNMTIGTAAEYQQLFNPFVVNHGPGGVTDWSQFHSIIKDDANYVVAGYSYIPTAEEFGTTAYIAKYDGDGNELWNNSFGGCIDDQFNSITKVADGYIVVGTSSSPDGDMAGLYIGNEDAIIAKYDTDGNLVWNKVYGGGYLDIFEKVISVNDGFVAVGYTESSSPMPNYGYYDAIIVKFDSSGNVVWQKHYGGSTDDIFNDIVQTDDGYIVVGQSTSNDHDLTGLNLIGYDAIIVKFDNNGDVVWDNNLGGSATDVFYSVVPTMDSHYIAVGSSNSTDGDLAGYNNGTTDAIITKWDSSGNLVWTQNYGGDLTDTFKKTILGSSGYIAIGMSSSSNDDLADFSKGGSDAIYVAYDTDGVVTSQQNFGGSLNDYFEDIVLESIGYTAVGYTNSTDQDLDGVGIEGQDAILYREM